MSSSVQRLQATGSAMRDALAKQDWAAIGELDLQCRMAVDAAMIFGTGWAPFRGGPLHYAKVRGDVPETLRQLAEKHGARFDPDSGWDTLG